MVHKPTFWNSDKIVSSLAFLVSTVTLLTLMYQTYLMQKQQYATVLPYVTIVSSAPDTTMYSLSLINNGIGPAFIQNISVHYKDSIYELDPSSFLQGVIYPHTPVSFSYASVSKGMLLPAEEKVNMVSIQGSEKDARILAGLFYDDAQVEVVYRSVFDETWRVSGIAGIPEKLDD